MKPPFVVLVAGGVILAGAFVTQNRDVIDNPPQSTREACDQLLDPALCQAATTAHALSEKRPLEAVDIPTLPDQTRTPGSVDPTIKQANISSTICNAAYLARLAPPASWKAATTRRIAAVLYPADKPENFALDQLVPVSLGGAPTDTRNLWLQPWTGESGYAAKDKLETLLNRMVCAGQLPLTAAQQAIAGNWLQTYHSVMTIDNLTQHNLPLQWSASGTSPQGTAQQMTAQFSPQNQLEPVVLEGEVMPQNQPFEGEQVAGNPAYEVPEIPSNDHSFLILGE